MEDSEEVTVTLKVKVSSKDATAVAVELFNAHWNSPYLQSLDELLINDKPVYNEVRDRWLADIKKQLAGAGSGGPKAA